MLTINTVVIHHFQKIPAPKETVCMWEKKKFYLSDNFSYGIKFVAETKHLIKMY